MIRERQFEVIQQVNPHLYCSICREVFYNPIRATCGHTFCGTCLVRWIQMKKSCPLCRHKLERNYQFDKDILATKLVGDVEVRCLRCLKWEGTLAQFKPHKKSQCTYVQVSNEAPLDAIEIGDNDNEFTFAGTIEENDNYQINENIGQPILVSLEQNQENSQCQLTPEQVQNQPVEAILNIETQDNQQDAQIEQQNQINVTIENNENPSQNIEQSNLSSQNQSNEQQDNQIIEINENTIQNKNPQPSENDIKIIQNLIENQQEIIQQQQQSDQQFEIQIEELNKKQNFSDNQQDTVIQIEEPPVRIMSNKEIKEFKASKKLRINILRNAVKIVEPHIEQIEDNFFINFVEEMKKEMIKRLSNTQYFNTLIG